MKLIGQIKNVYFGLIQMPEKELSGGLHLEFDFGGDNKGTYQMSEEVYIEMGHQASEVDLAEHTKKVGVLFLQIMRILQKSKCAHIELLKNKFVIAETEDNKIKSIQFFVDDEDSKVVLDWGR
jgi:hypothetical protein